MRVVYREREFIDRYRCIDHEKVRYFDKSWTVEGTSLIYFKSGQFTTFSIGKEDVIRIEA